MRFALDPGLPVLLRPDGAVQIGWDPRRAVLVRPPLGLSATAMATVLRAMSAPMTASDLHRLARRHGLDDEVGFDELLDALVAAVAEAKPVSSRTYMRQGIDCTEVVREDVWPDWLEPARAAIAAAKGQTP